MLWRRKIKADILLALGEGERVRGGGQGVLGAGNRGKKEGERFCFSTLYF